MNNLTKESLFVVYKDDNELIRLVNLLEAKGYKNVHEIGVNNLIQGTRVLIVDNNDISFSPCSITICALAKSSNKKFYKVDEFEKIFK